MAGELSEGDLRVTVNQDVENPRGGRVAPSVRGPTLGFGSGHDLMVRGVEPRIRLGAAGGEPAWESLSLPLGPSLTHAVSLSK